jgi:osmotically-inducible protein OsmY
MSRTSNLAVLVLGLTLAVPCGAQTVTERRTVTDEDVHDATLATRVRSLLLEKLGDDALNIDVRAAGPTVFLSGFVQKRPTSELAKEVALSVEGVKDVKDDVKEASPENPFKRAGRGLKDVALESHIKNKLLVDTGKNAFHVEVEVSEGVVSLRGHVPPGSVEQILRVARDTKGVKRVVNLLTTEWPR